jgi:hypothetical protein
MEQTNKRALDCINVYLEPLSVLQSEHGRVICYKDPDRHRLKTPVENSRRLYAFQVIGREPCGSDFNPEDFARRFAADESAVSLDAGRGQTTWGPGSRDIEVDMRGRFVEAARGRSLFGRCT